MRLIKRLGVQMPVFALIALGMSLAGAAVAQPADAPQQEGPAALGEVYACAGIADDAARLACFDAAVAGLRAAQEAGDILAVDREAVAQVEREAFGLSLPSLPRFALGRGGQDDRVDSASAAPGEQRDAETGQLDAVTFTLSALRARNDGRTVFTMDNGQRWEQVTAERVRSLRPGDAVSIRRASLGSYMLTKVDGGAAYRVRRVE